MNLSVLPELLAVCRLDADATIPSWVATHGFLNVTRTRDELSIVCADSMVPHSVHAQRAFRALKVEGPLDFSLTGILAELLQPLAAAKISIFTVSTFDTDYILVRESALDVAITALRSTGHKISE